MRTLQTIVIGFLATALAAGTAWAAGNTSSNSQSTTAANKKIDPKDPVAMAFRLPSGTTLNAKQEKAYEALKTKYEATLREALDLIHSKVSGDSAKGLKLNRDTRAEIRTGIQQILAMPYADAQKAAAANAAAYPRPVCPCGRRY